MNIGCVLSVFFQQYPDLTARLQDSLPGDTDINYVDSTIVWPIYGKDN